MKFDVIIIGGSYAGLSAALALARAVRSVLVVDAGQPCNRQTPYSHNFLTHDGDKPADISAVAKAEVLKYPTVQFVDGTVVGAEKQSAGFDITLASGENFFARKLLISTGLKDLLPPIKGFAACWAISIVHCPYCHGYEIRDEKIGLLMNGDNAFEMAKNLNHWNRDLTVLTNGKSNLTAEQTEKLASKSIKIIEEEIAEFEHEDGVLKNVVFSNRQKLALKAV